jgi:hypothetical protein
MRKSVVILFALIPLAFHAFCADTDYKLVRIETLTNAVRVRLPLTDVTGKVRVKEKTADGFGLPVAPSKTALGKKHYLEWQIGYDSPNTNSPTAVPDIKFVRNGETKYGHELSKIIFEAVRIGLISTNALAREMEALTKIPPAAFEENQPVQVEVATNPVADGFQSAVEHLPQFTKTTPHGWVQIQLKRWSMSVCRSVKCERWQARRVRRAKRIPRKPYTMISTATTRRCCSPSFTRSASRRHSTTRTCRKFSAKFLKQRSLDLVGQSGRFACLRN